MLGQILSALEQTGQTKNTLIIATGDNGALKRPYPPLRDAKSSIYEGGHREPFIARWPGRILPDQQLAKPSASPIFSLPVQRFLTNRYRVTPPKIVSVFYLALW